MREQAIQSLIYLFWGGDSSYRTENRWVKTLLETLHLYAHSVMEPFAVGEAVFCSEVELQ